MNQTSIFTDGSSKGNPGPGGWGAIISDGEKVVELGGREEHTTNNRMEMMAVIEALKYFFSHTDVVIHTDSEYVAKGASLWLSGWKKKGWKTAAKKEVLNRDLWEEIDALLQKVSVKWNVVTGHAGVVGNERCDEIATAFADGEKPNLFTGLKKDYKIKL